MQEAAPAARPDPLAAADRLLARGDYAAAADAYTTLATTLPAHDAVHVTALAALSLQDAGRAAEADALLAAIEPGSVANDPLVALASARAQLLGGHADAALALARQIEGATLTPYARGVQARVTSSAAFALQDFANAASAGLKALQLPYPSTEQAALTQSAWAALSRLSAGQLGEQRAASTAEPLANGWYTLATLAQQAGFDADKLAPRLSEWKQRYPGHPATVLLDSLLEHAVAARARPRRVALILPFDDTLGPAARAVRDGFMTAWFGDAETPARPAVSVYANSGDNILADYQRAVRDGAELIVGPLQKNLVERLKALPDMPVSVLALNVIDMKSGTTPPRAGFYQFGLTPEDEASQVAHRAYAYGTRALIIAPNSTWGTRLAAAYEKAWQDLGGTMLARISYSDSADAYPSAVRRAFNIDLSEARAAALRRRLGIPLHADTRIRADVDVILLAALPNNARQLLPQLRYFGADIVPIFATSNVYSGTSRATSDIDLNGLVFGDMPWLFGGIDAESFDFVRRSWPQAAQNYARLFAFGIDAYRIIPYLARMRTRLTMRVPGVTGDLWMDAEGVLHRNLLWIKFVEGVPTAIGESEDSVGIH